MENFLNKPRALVTYKMYKRLDLAKNVTSMCDIHDCCDGYHKYMFCGGCDAQLAKKKYNSWDAYMQEERWTRSARAGYYCGGCGGGSSSWTRQITCLAYDHMGMLDVLYIDLEAFRMLLADNIEKMSLETLKGAVRSFNEPITMFFLEGQVFQILLQTDIDRVLEEPMLQGRAPEVMNRLRILDLSKALNFCKQCHAERGD
jgi:hypothetical protein